MTILHKLAAGLNLAFFGEAIVLRYTWIYVVAFALAALRIMGHTSESYQAVAHLFVGGLFTAAWWQYQVTRADNTRPALRKLYVAVVLSLIELGCALWFRFMV